MLLLADLVLPILLVLGSGLGCVPSQLNESPCGACPGKGMSELTLADRATIANMSPEYGATMGFFPVDRVTLDYLRMTGRDEKKVTDFPCSSETERREKPDYGRLNDVLHEVAHSKVTCCSPRSCVESRASLLDAGFCMPSMHPFSFNPLLNGMH